MRLFSRETGRIISSNNGVNTLTFHSEKAGVGARFPEYILVLLKLTEKQLISTLMGTHSREDRTV